MIPSATLFPWPLVKIRVAQSSVNAYTRGLNEVSPPPHKGASNGERIRVIVVLPSWVVDTISTASRRSAVQHIELTDELRVVENVDCSLGEERLDFEICAGLVQVGALDRGVDVPAAVALGGFSHPLFRIPVAVDCGHSIGLRDGDYLGDNALQVDLSVPRLRPAPHDVVYNAPTGA